MKETTEVAKPLYPTVVRKFFHKHIITGLHPIVKHYSIEVSREVAQNISINSLYEVVARWQE